MGKKWTEAQVKAITEKNKNLLVSASAGSGKTAVLVERIFTRLWEQEELDLDRFLVVTFTNAAASEMREQIIARIEKALEKGEKTRHLKRQISLVPKAYIGTIHSFCLEVVRQHCLELGLDPVFKVMEEEEARMLKLEVAEALLEEMYSRDDREDFYSLVEALSPGRDDSGLVQNLIKVYDYIRSLPRPQAWLEEIKNFFSTDDCQDIPFPWVGWNRKRLARKLKAALNDLLLAIKLCDGPGGPRNYISRLEEECVLLQKALKDFEQGTDLVFCLESISFDRLPSVRNKEVDETQKERVQKLRNEVKSSINDLKESIWNRTKEEIINEMKETRPLVVSWVNLLQEFSLRFQQAKRLKGYLDFADLEQYCLALFTDEDPASGELKPSRIAEEWRQRFVEVLVDECQDLNGAQEAILFAVASPDKGNLFLVGDIKQSIYRFRNADPMLFLHRYKEWKDPEAGGLSLHLSENFRSRLGVIDGVNYLFGILMTEETAEVDYDEEAALVAKADYPAAPNSFASTDEIEFYLIEKNPADPLSDQADEREEEYSSQENAAGEEEEDFFDTSCLEARLVIKGIKKILAQGYQVWDKEKESYRPLTYRDMVILMRSVRGTAGVFAEEFQKAGIPCYAELATGFFEAPEVAVVLSLLKIIDNPYQDIPLLAVLRSPLYGLSSDQMAEIRIYSPDVPLFEAVNKRACLEDELGGKLRLFLSDLKKWRQTARFCSVADLLWEVLNQTGYYHFLGVLPGGKQRQANLRLLLNWAEKFEASSYKGLFSFLSFVASFQDTGQDRGKARSLAESEDVVRIMSIHKSKGLEFPVVFLCGLGRRFNTQDLKGEVLCHKELGLGLKISYPEKGIYYTTLAREAIKEKLREEALAEELRLLYVALTRAREKLILVGTANDLERSSLAWVEKAILREINPPKWTEKMLGASTYLDWLGTALVLHPDGEPLRALAGSEYQFKPDLGVKGRFSINLVHPADLSLLDEIEQEERIQEPVFSHSSPKELSDEVAKRLNWTYPYLPASGKSPKQSVTSLVGKKGFSGYAPEEWESRETAIFSALLEHDEAQDEKPSPLLKGNAYHKLLRHLDLKLKGKEDFAEQIKSLVEKEILSEEEAGAIDPRDLVKLVNSPLGKRLVSAKSLRREVPFNLLVPAGEIYPDLAPDPKEVVMVQGVIDCLAEEEDGYLLVDYKTDQIEGDKAYGRAQEYRSQLQWYRRAAESLFGVKVKDCFVYFTSCAVGIKVD